MREGEEGGTWHGDKRLVFQRQLQRSKGIHGHFFLDASVECLARIQQPDTFPRKRAFAAEHRVSAAQAGARNENGEYRILVARIKRVDRKRAA